MKREYLVYILAVAVLVTSGCTGSTSPDVDLVVDWKDAQGWVPLKANDMGIEDSRTLSVVVENNERLQVNGISIKVYGNIPNFKVAPASAQVMALGPRGTSKTSPCVFTLETMNTPPGKYVVWVSAEHEGRTIKTERISVDIG